MGSARMLPPGDLQSLMVNGVIGGVGGILVFPAANLHFILCVVAAGRHRLFVARGVCDGQGHAPASGCRARRLCRMLSAHACAIPAIMSTRVIENPRDRLVTILITPLMTCSARIPVYAMVTALLFPQFAAEGGGGVHGGLRAPASLAALGAALVFRRTILPGESKPLMIELPPYRLPGLRTALLHTFDRAKIFVKQAGTIILAISLVLWALSYYPKSAPARRRRGHDRAGRAIGKIRRRGKSRMRCAPTPTA